VSIVYAEKNARDGWNAPTTRTLQQFEDVLKDDGKGVSKQRVFTEQLPSLQDRRWSDIQRLGAFLSEPPVHHDS